MADATPTDLRRIALSKQVLEGYERIGFVDTPVEGARLVRGEIGALEALIKKYPRRAEILGALVTRYRALLRNLEN